MSWRALVHETATLLVGSLRSQESWDGSWRAKVHLVLLVVTVALLVSLGRVYKGVRYPSDRISSVFHLRPQGEEMIIHLPFALPSTGRSPPGDRPETTMW